MEQTLLVTGATGMVGSSIARRALREGMRVRALVRNPSYSQLLQPHERLELHQGDLSNPDALSGALEGVDLVAHAAGRVGDWGPAAEYFTTNVIGLSHLMLAAAKAGAKRLVHISSLGVYPPRDHAGTDERDPMDDAPRDPYTKSKVEAENLVAQLAADLRLPAVVLRPGLIYGEGDRYLLPRLVERLTSGTLRHVGSGRNVVNNTYVENLTDAVLLAFHAEGIEGETFNIRDRRLITSNELVEAVARCCGHEAPTRRVPRVAAVVAARVAEIAARLSKSQMAPFLTRASIKFMALNLDFSIEKAQRRLRYNPNVDFVDGIRRAYAWFEANHGR